METEDDGHAESSDGNSTLYCYHSDQHCCRCPDFLKQMLKTASWKSEKVYILHCNECGGTTIRELRSLYIDESYNRSHSMQHEWQCCHCGFLNSDYDTVSNCKNTSLLDAENSDSWNEAISRSKPSSSIFTSTSNLYSCSCQTQKSDFSMLNSDQCKFNKKNNENFGKWTKNDECDRLIINESQIVPSIMDRSRIETERVKWVTNSKTAIFKSYRVSDIDIATESLKASIERKNSPLCSISIEESEDGIKSNPEGSKLELLKNGIFTPSELNVDHWNMEYDMKRERSFSADPLETAIELKCEATSSCKEILKTERQISETDPCKFVDVVKRNSEEKISGHLLDSLDMVASSGNTHNSSINNNEISKTSSIFVDTDSLLSSSGHTINSKPSVVDLKVGRSDKKYDNSTVTAICSPKQCFTVQSTANNAEYIRSCYHYRTPTLNKASGKSQLTPQYMAPTISSVMKMKQMEKQYNSPESLSAISCQLHLISKELSTAAFLTPSRNKNKENDQSELQEPSIKICRKKRFVRSSEAELLTTECDAAKKSKHQNLQRTSTKLLPRAACHSGGLYHTYLKPLFWDRITSRNDKISQKERFMEKDRTVDLAMNLQNADTKTSLHSKEVESLLSPRNSCQEETYPFHFDKVYLQQPECCASHFVEPASAQVGRTVSSQRIAPLGHSPYTSSKLNKYNIWQRVLSNSPQKISRFKRFSRSEIKDANRVSQLSQYILRLRQSTDQFASTETRMPRAVIWKRTISKSLPQVSRLNRFPISENFPSKIFQESPSPQRFGREVLPNFLEIRMLLLNMQTSLGMLPIQLLRGLPYEQSNLVSDKSDRSSLYVSQPRLPELFLTESQNETSETLPEKHHSNFTIRLLRSTSSSECLKLSFASIHSDNSSFEESLNERSKSTPSKKFSYRSRFLTSRYLTSSCVWNKSTKGTVNRSSRIERFQNFTSNPCIAQSQLSSSSLFPTVSLTPSGRRSLWMQMKATPSKIVSRYQRHYPDFHDITVNTSEAMKTLDRSSRFKRFRDNFSSNTHTAQFTLAQNSSARIFLKKRTKRGVSHKISREERFKIDTACELMIPETTDSLEYSLLTTQQRSPEQSLICNSTNLCKEMLLTDSTAQLADSDQNQQLKQQINYEEQFENCTSIDSNIFDTINFNEIREKKSEKLSDSGTVQQTQSVSHLDRTGKQNFDDQKLSASELVTDNDAVVTKDVSFSSDARGKAKKESNEEGNVAVVEGIESNSVQMDGTNLELSTSGNVALSSHEIHMAFQTEFQSINLYLSGITTSERTCIRRIVVNGREVYRR